MVTWLESLVGHGVYESNEYTLDISKGTHYIDASFKYDDSKAPVYIDYKYKVDNEQWTEWLNLVEDSGTLFKGLKGSKITYKIRVRVESTTRGSGRYSYVSIKSTDYLVFINSGDLPTYPKLWIKKTIERGAIKLINKTNNTTLGFKTLCQNETVFIDGENRIIKSDYSLVNRYKDHNEVWMKLEVGENLFIREGEFEFDIRYESPMLHE